MNFKQIQALVANDMKYVDLNIKKQLKSDIDLIEQLGNYIINAGGKRIRPMLTLLAAKATGYTGINHQKAAAFIEFIHTATLLHDDVVDESDLRRGKPSANFIYGNSASILVGDYIYTRSFQMMVELNSLKLLDLMSTAVNVIAAGEVQQLSNLNKFHLTENDYMQVIYSKTARLFEVATQIGAVIGEQDASIELALQNYGRFLGTAFQLIDDLLDYTAKQSILGKTVGDDLAEGKLTLPLIHAMDKSSPADLEKIQTILASDNKIAHLKEIISIMQTYDSLEYTKLRAIIEAKKAISALDPLPNSIYKEALIGLAQLAIDRKK